MLFIRSGPRAKDKVRAVKVSLAILKVITQLCSEADPDCLRCDRLHA